MKYQKHYLSDDKNWKVCPINTKFSKCDSYCAWFDHENQDCRQLGMMWKIKEDLQEINRTIFEGFEYIGGKKIDKREFKF